MKYTLMHRELPVAVLGINDISGTVYRVDEIMNEEHLPLGTRASKVKAVAQNLNGWLSGRAIPASRSGFRQAVEDVLTQKGVELSSALLLMRCLALSLSDQYWLNPVESPLQWQDVNFYDNSFSDDVGNILFGEFPKSQNLDLVSPCNTSDGWLKKKWKIIDGHRVLVKGGSGLPQQEPFNEVVAAAICKRLGIPHVRYSVLWENGKPYSVCPNMTTNRQDLVSAYALYSSGEKPDHMSAFDYFIERCEQLGIPGARRSLSQMLVLDFLICNQDRHYGNFGALRDAVTLEWLGMAPIYDSGTSMWQDRYANQIQACADTQAKPFCKTHRTQIELVAGDLDWLDFSALHGLQEEAYTIYEQAHFGEASRAAVLSQALATRCDYLQTLVHELTLPVVSVKEICQRATTRAAEINAQNLTANQSARIPQPEHE